MHVVFFGQFIKRANHSEETERGGTPVCVYKPGQRTRAKFHAQLPGHYSRIALPRGPATRQRDSTVEKVESGLVKVKSQAFIHILQYLQIPDSPKKKTVVIMSSLKKQTDKQKKQ